MLSGEIDYLVGEGLMQDLQRLAQPFGALAERSPVQSGPVVLVFDRTAADAELKPACRDLVQGRGHLRQDRGVTELVAQHHVSDSNALGTAEQCRGQGPGFHRGIVGRPWTVEVVVEPQRVDAQLFAEQCAMQDWS